MAALDVEALLDATAKNTDERKPRHTDDDERPKSSRSNRSDRRDRDRDRDGSRERDREYYDRKRREPTRAGGGAGAATMTVATNRAATGEETATTTAAPAVGRALDRARPVDGTRGGEYRDRRDRSDRYGGEQRQRGGRDDDRRETRKREATPQPTEDERDRRTVFVQQLAARLRTRELKEFFEKIGAVNEAQIVKDRISQRSKGVGYVEFKEEESVALALQLTGQKLLGIPIIVQLTEAEKNRQVRNTDGSNGQPNSIPFHRLYVGNIHFNVTEQDLQAVFEPFGHLEFVQLQKDEHGRSRGYGFVQFRDATQAREALEKMNGFDLAGRAIRVGLGNDKFTPESTANLLQRFSGQNSSFQGSAFSGAGGRNQQNSTFDRAGGRDNDKAGGASALDDTDVAGVNFNNYSRDALMRKLARTDETSEVAEERQILKPKTEVKALPVNVNMASRCVVLHNMFDPNEEEGDSWVKELEEDVRGEAEQRYGHVVHISVDPNSNGDIYLKFDKVQGGENAIKGLNGRYFGGRMIDASPVVDAVYSRLFYGIISH
ncbi:unnamed protein product [Parascedosporium putredinis]|uniref:RRM domain-containing protein n=1 Tax=Parascedosporium putredinis TaxID=1442378 RepID=A0A9P1M7R1_9PEZI|nr:unnamed protein product [Parascedosporium putredinis]CAI7988744.1 unnamed protein product [Parascedosporium putredinis]